MKQKTIIIAIISLIPLMLIPAYAVQDTTSIPSWIKVVAEAWSNDKLTDTEFKEAITFLIDAQVIKIGTTQIVQTSMSDLEKDVYDLKIKNLEDDLKNWKSDNVTIEEHKKMINSMNKSCMVMTTNQQQDITELYEDLKNEERKYEETIAKLIKEVRALEGKSP